MSQMSPFVLAQALLEWGEDERRQLVAKLGQHGYELIDELDTGEYTLALWKGSKTRDGQPVRFYEMSLNLKGQDFSSEEAQMRHVPVTGHPPRLQMLRRVRKWLDHFPQLYVGSFDDRKLRLYLNLFRRHFAGFRVSAPFAAFDDSVKDDYFTVTAGAGR